MSECRANPVCEKMQTSPKWKKMRRVRCVFTGCLHSGFEKVVSSSLSRGRKWGSEGIRQLAPSHHIVCGSTAVAGQVQGYLVLLVLNSRFFTPSFRTFLPCFLLLSFIYFPKQDWKFLHFSTHVLLYFAHVSLSLLMLLRVLEEPGQILPPPGSLPWLSQTKLISVSSKTPSALSHSEIFGEWVPEETRKDGRKETSSYFEPILCQAPGQWVRRPHESTHLVL